MDATNNECLTASVIIVTYNRPDHVRTCLEHVEMQDRAPLEVIVVDASPDERTYQVVSAFPRVTYLRNPLGAGTTATSRRIGFGAAAGDIIVFIDDDAFPRADWLDKLLEPYADPSVGAVGGRASNGIPGEEDEGLDEIGLLLPDGTLTGNFGANPGHVIPVDHLLGANHSYRRNVVVQVGGIHDAYPGTCLREETDTALRVRQAGWTLLFTPFAVVDHVAGPYAKGKRFDLRYTYYSHRNHLVLLSRTVGLKDPMFRRYLQHSAADAGRSVAVGAARLTELRSRGGKPTVRSLGGGVARAAAVTAGVAVGFKALIADRSVTRAELAAAAPHSAVTPAGPSTTHTAVSSDRVPVNAEIPGRPVDVAATADSDAARR